MSQPKQDLATLKKQFAQIEAFDGLEKKQVAQIEAFDRLEKAHQEQVRLFEDHKQSLDRLQKRLQKDILFQKNVVAEEQELEESDDTLLLGRISRLEQRVAALEKLVPQQPLYAFDFECPAQT